ncbi:MAG: hypothetical protein KatS3mg003_1933 [Candidatus Nitrosocaldaceae archaeon]|nr:MAG: hypothetical protein KatS3mg003_1933 [Candidatus Nitrosocaldaceae archaeon]
MAEEEALGRVKKFVAQVKKLIERVSADDLIEKGGVNPYMVNALGMETIEEVVEFFVNRRVERSLGTSFGNVIDDVIRILLGGVKGRDLVNQYGKWIKWWDVVIPDQHIVVSIKSGPADMNKDQVLYFVQRAKEAESNGFRPFLVFGYGKRAFPVIENYLRDKGYDPGKYLRIGKAVFEEFLKNPEYYKTALEVFGTAGREARARDVFELVEEKTMALAEELKKRYGNDINRMIEDMF